MPLHAGTTFLVGVAGGYAMDAMKISKVTGTGKCYKTVAGPNHIGGQLPPRWLCLLCRWLFLTAAGIFQDSQDYQFQINIQFRPA
jgi:hypothetical protein